MKGWKLISRSLSMCTTFCLLGVCVCVCVCVKQNSSICTKILFMYLFVTSCHSFCLSDTHTDRQTHTHTHTHGMCQRALRVSANRRSSSPSTLNHIDSHRYSGIHVCICVVYMCAHPQRHTDTHTCVSVRERSLPSRRPSALSRPSGKFLTKSSKCIMEARL